MSDEYDAFIADVTGNTPGTLESTIEAELAVVLRDFCQVTSAWKQDYEVPVDKDHNVYKIQPMQGAEVNLLHRLFAATDPDQKPVVAIGGYQMSTPGVLVLATAPSAATWVATVSLYPVRNITGPGCRAVVPGWLLDRYYDTLQHGVLSRLMRQVTKPYTNLALGTLHGASYGAGRSNARADLARSNIHGVQQWQYPRATTARGRQRGA